MNQQVQSAFDAANRGENNKALGILKQVLAANPDDVDAWLVLAAVVEQPERKRQCLNRVLALNPTNAIARNELLDMDRAAMSGTSPSAAEAVSQPAYLSTPAPPNYSTSTSTFDPDYISHPTYPSEHPTSTSAFEPEPDPDIRQSAPTLAAPAVSPAQAKVASRSWAKGRRGEPLMYTSPVMFRVSIILTHIFVVILGCVGLVMVLYNFSTALICLGLALAMEIASATITSSVEINEAGIRASGVLWGSEAKWGDIKSIKSNGLKRRLELHKKNGRTVKISTQVDGYPHIVKILQQERPDLFGMAAFSSLSGQGNMATSGSEQASSNKSGGSTSAPAFRGRKKFKKSLFKQFGSYFLTLPLGAYAFWITATEPENRIGAFIVAVACAVYMIFPLFDVNAVTLEPNKLTIETLFEQKVFKAREISEIRIQTSRMRKSALVRHYVTIGPLKGKDYPLQGFSDGDEVIYGFLMNWWNTYIGQ